MRRWTMVDWLWAALVTCAMLIVLLAAGRYAATADPMPPDMRADVDAYRAELHAEFVEWLTEINGPWVEPAPHDHPQVTYGEGVEQWRDLVAQYFPAAWVEWTLQIMECESGGRPNAANPNSSARGLMQHLGRFWDDRSARAGWAGADIFDPTANIAVAAWLLDGGKGWRHWECRALRP